MDDFRERWSALSRPWKTFWIALVITLVFFVATGFFTVSPVFALISALIWAAGAASIVRIRDHYIPPDEDPRNRQ